MKWPARIFALVLFFTFTGAAIAQDAAPSAADIRAAAQAFDRGRAAYKAEAWTEAAEAFEAADASAQSGQALELAMRSRDSAGQLDRAATLAQLALKRHADEPVVGTYALDVIGRAREQLHEATVLCDEPCELVLDNKIVHGRPESERIVYVNPGPHELRASWPGDRTLSQSMDAVVEGQSEITFQAPPGVGPAVETPAASTPETSRPPPATPKDEPPAKASSGLSPLVFYVAAGATAIAGGVTIWSGIDTQNNPGPDAVEQQCSTISDPEACAPLQEGLKKQTRTNVLIGVTAGLAVVTAAIGILATDWSGGGGATGAQPAKERSGVALTVEPWLDLGRGATVSAVGRF